MSTYLKPQTPLYSKKNDAYIYPLTTSDQIIMPDGSRLTPDKLEAMILETATPDAIGALSMELLWENASPTSEVGAFNIYDLNISEYRSLKIIFRYATTIEWEYNAILNIGVETLVSAGMGRNLYKVVNTKNGIVHFEQTKIYNNYAGEAADNTIYLIPIRIYGVKGGTE